MEFDIKQIIMIKIIREFSLEQLYLNLHISLTTEYKNHLYRKYC